MAKTLIHLLEDMESMPHLFRIGHDYSQDDILRIAAEIRRNAGLPPTHLVPMEVREAGLCNGCASPIFIPAPVSMYERAQRRPPDFLTRSPAEQWAIDKALGILDWDGTDDRKTKPDHPC